MDFVLKLSSSNPSRIIFRLTFEYESVAAFSTAPFRRFRFSSGCESVAAFSTFSLCGSASEAFYFSTLNRATFQTFYISVWAWKCWGIQYLRSVWCSKRQIPIHVVIKKSFKLFRLNAENVFLERLVESRREYQQGQMINTLAWRVSWEWRKELRHLNSS